MRVSISVAAPGGMFGPRPTSVRTVHLPLIERRSSFPVHGPPTTGAGRSAAVSSPTIRRAMCVIHVPPRETSMLLDTGADPSICATSKAVLHAGPMSSPGQDTSVDLLGLPLD